MATLYFDIETVPDFERVDVFPVEEPEPLPEELPVYDHGRFLDRTVPPIVNQIHELNPSVGDMEKLANAERNGANRKGVLAALEKQLKRHEDYANAVKQYHKTLSVTPEYCRIVAIGWAVNGSAVKSVLVSDGDPEAGLLAGFWRIIQSNNLRLCGYNVAGFDLPTIFARSAILGVQPSRKLDLRPWGNDVLDLMKQRFPTGRAMKLKDMARLYGIDVPAEDTDGSQVMDLWENDPEKLGEYVRSDVAITRDLHQTLQGYFWL